MSLPTDESGRSVSRSARSRGLDGEQACLHPPLNMVYFKHSVLCVKRPFAPQRGTHVFPLGVGRDPGQCVAPVLERFETHMKTALGTLKRRNSKRDSWEKDFEDDFPLDADAASD